MTLEETRRLGIEFERRIQTMIPEKEFLDKLDTETIYSFLNQYQDKYIHDIYRNLDSIPSGTKIQAHIESILLSLLRDEFISVEDGINATDSIVDPNDIEVMDTGRSVIYPLDPKFYMYIRSVSKVSGTYSFKSNPDHNNSSIRVIPNELVSQSDVWKLIETPHDSLRILRRPAAVLSAELKRRPTLTVIYDQYTTPLGIKVLYYAQPQHFDLMTSTACELPIDCFDDLVTGAIELYVQYASGAEANRRRLIEAALLQQKRNNENED